MILDIRKDPEDSRDLIYRASGIEPPPFKSLEGFLIDIEDQKSTSSCTAHAGSSGFELLVKQFKPAKAQEFSRLHLYYWTRFISNLHGKDGGAYTRDICKALEKYGICPESDWPFNTSKINVKPSFKANIKGKLWRIKSYERCNDIRAAIADGLPVIIGAQIREGLNSLKGPRDTHLAQLSNYPQTKAIGGHAMLVVGYDDRDASYLIANSWGTGWGDNGLFKIDRGMIHADMRDAWAITGIKNWFALVKAALR